MEQWSAAFLANPLSAIISAVVVGVLWYVKNRQEKTTDNREVARLTAALDAKDRQLSESQGRADEAFRKQLELTERFSQMSAQCAKLEVQLDSVGKQLTRMSEDNAQLRAQVAQLSKQNGELTDKVSHMQATIDAGRA